MKSTTTVPHGHILDTFGLGEEQWLRYRRSGSTEGPAWCLREDAIAAAAKEEKLRKRKLREEEMEKEYIFDFTEEDEIPYDLSNFDYDESEEEESYYNETRRHGNQFIDDEAGED